MIPIESNVGFAENPNSVGAVRVAVENFSTQIPISDFLRTAERDAISGVPDPRRYYV